MTPFDTQASVEFKDIQEPEQVVNHENLIRNDIQESILNNDFNNSFEPFFSDNNLDLTNDQITETDTPTINNQFDESNIQYFKLKLFNKYRYRCFNSSEGRRELFSLKNRPSIVDWDKSLKLLVKTNVLSVITAHKFKFNLLIDGTISFLNHEYMIKSITRSLNKEILKKLSAPKLRRNVKLSLRPTVNEWANYLEDLASDNFLVKEEQGLNTFYSLN